MSNRADILSPQDPATHLFAITPSDSVDLPHLTRGLWIGTGGDINIVAICDTAAVVLKNVPGGVLLPIQAVRVYSSSTSASDIVGVY